MLPVGNKELKAHVICRARAPVFKYEGVPPNLLDIAHPDVGFLLFTLLLQEHASLESSKVGLYLLKWDLAHCDAMSAI